MRFPRIPALAIVALLLAPWGVRAEESYEERIKPGHCPCDAGEACWHYLRSPMRAPEDPCRCGCCLAGGSCAGKDRPKGTGAACWGSPKAECFFKRHAWSWRIACSECWQDTECPACDEDLGGPDPKAAEELKVQLEVEGASRTRPLWIAISPHFYVVTDLHHRVKVRTEGGAPRLMSGHEFVHLYAQRCEQAYDDFVHWFGDRVQLSKPMAVYLVQRKQAKEEIGAKYFGSPRTAMLFGGGSNRIGGGLPGNGFVGCAEEIGEDRDLHGYCRHMVGNVLFSCWIVVNGQEDRCPVWAMEGAGHFLGKLLEIHQDYAHYCTSETQAPTGSGKDWDRRARAMAAGRMDPILTFFARDSLGRLRHEDHIRAWSLMDLGLREDRERWLKVLASLRAGNEEGVAIKEGMGVTADDFQQRWVDRLTGRRKTLGEVPADARAEDEDPTARERRRVAETADPDVLAGLVRGLDVVRDPKTAEVVISRLDHPSDLVREAIHGVLVRTTEPAVLAVLREKGLGDAKPAVRAGVARALASLKDPAARPALEALLGDAFWLARANAAFALGALGDPAALPALLAASDERNDKAWIAVCDALAALSPPSKEATLRAVARLSASAWQVRVTACRGLARFGTEEAIDPLIERYETETGRLHRELRAALKAVTREDQGETPANWRRWWDDRKKAGGGLPPEPPQIRNPADDRYAPPKVPPRPEDPRYYGRTIYSKSVGFVLDTSKSMETRITVPEEAVQRLGDIPATGQRFDIAKQVLVSALSKLDPRTRISLVFFSTEVRPWKDAPVPASPGNVDAAVAAVRNAPADGETNIHGALRAALGLYGKATVDATLDPIPDTVWFLTDGSPTRGEITSAPEILGWFADLNRFAKVQLNVVALGTLGIDLPFLQELANLGGGEFVHVPER